jgi:hypothetical protein
MERQRGIHAIKTHLGNLHCFHAYCGDTVFQSGWSIVKLVHFDFFLKIVFYTFYIKRDEELVHDRDPRATLHTRLTLLPT